MILMDQKLCLHILKNIKIFGIMLIISKTKNNGYIIYGRSDSTLNPGGVKLEHQKFIGKLKALIKLLKL